MMNVKLETRWSFEAFSKSASAPRRSQASESAGFFDLFDLRICSLQM